MSEETMVRHCSPTLTGIKTGNMFSCAFDDWTSLKSSIRRFNRLLADKGLRIFPLRLKENRALIYVCRPARLIKDLQCAGAVSILEELGYPTETLYYRTQKKDRGVRKISARNRPVSRLSAGGCPRLH